MGRGAKVVGNVKCEMSNVICNIVSHKMLKEHFTSYICHFTYALVLVALMLLFGALPASATVYYVNDSSTVGDSFTSAPGNDANDGLTPATPKRTLNAVAAIDAAGDTVYVDFGVYAQDVTLDRNGLFYIGNSISRPIVGTGGAAATAITASFANTFTIMNFHTIGGNTGIQCTGDNSVIENCFVESAAFSGIAASGGADTCIVRNNIVNGCGGGGGTTSGITLQGTFHTAFNNRIDSFAVYAIDVVSGSRNVVDSNYITNGRNSGFEIRVAADLCTVTNNVITNCWREGVATSASTVDTCYIAGNRMSNLAFGGGMNIQGTDHRIYDNVIDSVATDGMIAFSASRLTIDSNIVRDVKGGGGDGIELNATSGHTITNNVFESCAVNGINLATSGSNTIRNNVISSCATGIIFSSAGSNVVESNRVDSNSVGFSLTSSSSNKIRFNALARSRTASIFLSNSSDNVVSGNEISGDPTNHISLNGTSARDSITRNNILVTTIASGRAVTNGVSVNSRLDMTRNYWGTADSATIALLIAGAKDSFVHYVPFRLGTVDTATADTVAPRAPDTITVAWVSDTVKSVNWGPATVDEDGNALTGLAGYRLYRTSRLDSTSYMLVGATDSTVTSLSDSGLAPTETRVYRVTAYDTRTPFPNESFFSDTAAVSIVGTGIVTDTPRIRIQAASPVETRVGTFSLRVAVDSASIGDSVRLYVNSANIETQTMSDTNETRTFTVVLNSTSGTIAVQVRSGPLSATITETLAFVHDTTAPAGSTLAIADTFVTTPVITWTAIADSSGIALYRVIVRSLNDSSVLLFLDTIGVSAVCTPPLAAGLYRADLSCTDDAGNANFNVDSRTFTVVPDTSRVRIQATSPLDTATAAFVIQAAIDSAAAGDTVRLLVRGVVIETQVVTATNETRSFTVSAIVYNNTCAVQVTRHIGGRSFADTILVRLDTVAPSGAALSIGDTTSSSPILRWSAAFDSTGVAAYRVILRSLNDSSTLLAFDTSGLSAVCTASLSVGAYRADLSCTDLLGNAVTGLDSRAFNIVPETSRIRIQSATPLDTRTATFTLRAAIDSAVAGDTVRLIVRGVVTETQIMTGTNETRSFTVSAIVYENTTVVQVTRYVGGRTFADTIAVRLDTVAPTGAAFVPVADTVVAIPVIRWSAATDSTGTLSYGLRLLSVNDSSRLLLYETTALSVQVDSPLSGGLYRIDLFCTDAVGNASGTRSSDTFQILPSSGRIRILSANPLDTRFAFFLLRAAADTATIGDSFRLVVNGVNIDTKMITAVNDTVTFSCTVALTTNTVLAQLYSTILAQTFTETLTVNLDTIPPAGSVITVTDTSLRTPTIRWTAATDFSVISAYRLRILSQLDSSTALSNETTGLSVAVDSALIFGRYFAELICTDAVGNVNSSVDTEIFNIIPETPTLTSPANFSCTGVRTITLTVSKNAGTDTLLIYRNGVLSDTVVSTATTVARSFNLDTATGRDTTFINFRAQVMRNGVVLQSIYSDTFMLCYDSTFPTSPASVTVSGTQAFSFSPGGFSAESAQILVRDANGNKLVGVAVTCSVVARPTGATGESLTYTRTDANGIARINLKAGDKAGAYVVKVTVESLSPIYIGFQTFEYDLPANQWRMIGLPRVPTNAATAQALAGVAPRDIFHWNPLAPDHANNRRYEVPTSLAPGDGYFIWSQAAVRFSVSGSTTYSDTRDFALKTGWNQFGAPFANLTRYSDARILTPGGATLTLAEAEAQGLIVNKVFWYRDNAYQWGPNSTNADPILAPWNGFWIYAASPATLRLSPYFYYSEAATAPIATAMVARAAAVNDWRVKITSLGAAGAQTVSFLGVSPSASEAADFALDVQNPPAQTGGMASGLGSGAAFAQDLRAPFASANQWVYSVTPGAGDTTITLQFGDLANLPADFVLWMIDLTTNQVTDVRAASAYSYAPLPGAVRSFRVLAGTEAAVRSIMGQSLEPNQTFVHPNPGPGADGFVRFKYNVTAGGTLRLKVFDLGGRKVIDRTVDLNAFPTEYPWDCRNDHGTRISTGVYITILEFASSTSSRRITDKLAIIR
jgi:parallel beta-helix repeat protein